MRRFEVRLARVALESARRHDGLLPIVAVAVVLQPPVPTIRPMNSLMLTPTHHEEGGDYDDIIRGRRHGPGELLLALERPGRVQSQSRANG